MAATKSLREEIWDRFRPYVVVVVADALIVPTVVIALIFIHGVILGVAGLLTALGARLDLDDAIHVILLIETGATVAALAVIVTKMIRDIMQIGVSMTASSEVPSEREETP